LYTVVLVGAGATLAEAESRRPSSIERPPLDSTFFSLCESAQYEGRHTVSQYMRRRYGIDVFGDPVGMESVFNYLYADAISPTSSDDTVQAYWLLIRMYAEAITRTTRGLRGTSRTGVGGLLRHLWRHGTETFDIVTFNQDLVIENALEEMVETKRYSEVPWSLRLSYQFQFEGAWETDLGTGDFGEHAVHPSTRPIHLLKLHGSLNWMYQCRSSTDARNALRQPTGRPGCLLSRKLPIELRAERSGRKVHLLPLVIPPIFEKSQQITAQLEPVWAAAEAALSRAERLIVFGYSFPDADFAGMALLRRSFVANEMLDSITVIDPDPTVAGKVASLTGAGEVRLYRSLRAFLDTAE